MATLSNKNSVGIAKNGIGKVSNELIESFIKKNHLVALKMLFYFSKMNSNFEINTKNDELVTLELNTQDLLSSIGIDSKTLRRNLKKMSEMSISITDEKKESFISVLPKVNIFYTGKMQIFIFKEILDLVYDVKKRFTIIDIDEIMSLTSKHSIRMLSLLNLIRNYDSIYPKRKTFDLDELNLFFGTAYKRIGHIEQSILIPTKAELDKNNNLSFIYEVQYDKEDTTKKGRAKAVGIKIDLVDRKKQKQTNEEIKYKQYIEQKKEIYREHEQQGTLGIVWQKKSKKELATVWLFFQNSVEFSTSTL